ncbi:hypothetical protein F5X68DRAFT_264124 [Plectosphaerella plurivora]|uniref:Uncharacterized protein n=1 Tax=Plectosphaerella plurivora TaxID=936078 RepID=A0A9P8V5D0_9PEZI|nr:hypothetical protein F5X68DRAFT_264124 [Plectosphaerella plurivora]
MTSNNTSSKMGPSMVTELLVRERDKSISKPVGPIKKKDDPVDDIVRMAAAGIGFASEAIQHRRQKKAAAAAAAVAAVGTARTEGAPSSQPSLVVTESTPITLPMTTDSTEHHEAPSDGKKQKNKNLAEDFIARHPFDPTPAETPHDPIPLPVVLVQRRPKTRARGFVRAYAPSLGAAGVDQDTFIDFIDTFNKALEPDPWLNAINLADLATMAAPIPEPFGLLLGFAIGAAAEGTMEAQSRYRSNRFLDRINAEFFAPRGLICFPATWRPQAKDELVTKVGFEGQSDSSTSESTAGLSRNLKDAVERQVSSLNDSTSANFQEKLQKKMNSHSGYLHWPEPAPLVHVPETTSSQHGEASGDSGKEKKKVNAFDRAALWLDDHVDKHSQARFIEKNPDVPMATALPQPTFRSRYADPNHPAASGDLVAFLTGGSWQSGGKGKVESSSKASSGESETEPQTEKERLKAEKKQEKEQKKLEKGKARLEKEEQKKREKKDKKLEKNAGKTGLSSLFQMDVLYLIVTNLPSESQNDEVEEEVPLSRDGDIEPPPYTVYQAGGLEGGQSSDCAGER